MISAMHRKRNLVKIISFVVLMVLSWLIIYKKERKNLTSAKLKVRGKSNQKSDNARIDIGVEGSPCLLEEYYQYMNTHTDEYGVSVACSNSIPLNRSLPDTRKDECKGKTYPEDLPKASVIIVFQSYTWSTLMRTIHSVINRSPPNLLEEILLVDDYSGYPNIQEKLHLDDFNIKVNLIQNNRKRGSIHARSYGAKKASGEVIIFLSAYCEVNVDWLPPLLERIHRKKNTVAVPITDMINAITFEYRKNNQYDVNYVGIFSWDLQYKERRLPPLKSNAERFDTDPYKSPVFRGGMFAIKRDFFLALIGYDFGLHNARGENIDLSFRIWLCGGTIEKTPCSHVGDIFQGFLPTFRSPSREETRKDQTKHNLINNKIIVETWFDKKHKEYYYNKQPVAYFVDPGNISNALSLKDKLKCNSFEWYMNNVANYIFEIYPKPPSNMYWGNLLYKQTNTCVGIREFGPQDELHLIPCTTAGLEQIIRLNINGYLEIGEKCIESSKHKTHVVSCSNKPIGPWKYIKETHDLYHKVKKKCLEREDEDESLFLAPCDATNPWIFIPYKFT